MNKEERKTSKPISQAWGAKNLLEMEAAETQDRVKKEVPLIIRLPRAPQEQHNGAALHIHHCDTTGPRHSTCPLLGNFELQLWALVESEGFYTNYHMWKQTIRTVELQMANNFSKTGIHLDNDGGWEVGKKRRKQLPYSSLILTDCRICSRRKIFA